MPSAVASSLPSADGGQVSRRPIAAMDRTLKLRGRKPSLNRRRVWRWSTLDRASHSGCYSAQVQLIGSLELHSCERRVDLEAH